MTTARRVVCFAMCVLVLLTGALAALGLAVACVFFLLADGAVAMQAIGISCICYGTARVVSLFIPWPPGMGDA